MKSSRRPFIALIALILSTTVLLAACSEPRRDPIPGDGILRVHRIQAYIPPAVPRNDIDVEWAYVVIGAELTLDFEREGDVTIRRARLAEAQDPVPSFISLIGPAKRSDAGQGRPIDWLAGRLAANVPNEPVVFTKEDTLDLLVGVVVHPNDLWQSFRVGVEYEAYGVTRSVTFDLTIRLRDNDVQLLFPREDPISILVHRPVEEEE